MSDDIRLDPALLSRVEVFGDMHAAKVGAVDVEIEVQDDGRTLKIWLTKNADKQAQYMANLRANRCSAPAPTTTGLADRFARSCSHDDDLSCAGCEVVTAAEVAEWQAKMRELVEQRKAAKGR